MSTREAGQRHRELVARRSREKTRSVQEIAPLPAMKDPKRRMACRKDLKAFCLSYFPKRFKLAFSSYHLQVIERLESIALLCLNRADPPTKCRQDSIPSLGC